MRLSVLDGGHRRPARMFMAMTRATSGVEMADVVKLLLYRPEFYGRAMLGLSAAAMRGPSFWTAGEREFMAAFTARLHQTTFCVRAHTELVRIASDGQIDPADPHSARPELAAVLPFLEKVTLTPEQVGTPDVVETGVGEEAILEALRVNFMWNSIDRLGNAFDFQVDSEKQLHKGAQALHRFGYKMPGFVTGGRVQDHEPGALVDAVREAVLHSPATIDPATRAAAATGDPLDEPWQSYAAKVRDHSDQVTDADIKHLTAAGHSEDEIFEITVSAATGAALRSLKAGLRVIR